MTAAPAPAARSAATPAPALSLDGHDVVPFAFVLAAAHQRGLLAALERGAADAAALTATLGLDARAAALALELLVSFGIAERRSDGGYALGPALREAARLVPGGLANDLAVWSHLSGFLTHGDPVTDMDGGTDRRAALYAGVAAGLGQMWAGAAGQLAVALAGHGPRVLDVGCGSGVWSLALAAARPDCTVTGVDLPPVLPAFEERARAVGAAGRARPLGGDAHAIQLADASFDVVIVANLLRLESPPRAAALLARLAPALAPGGQLVVVDALAGGTPAAERRRAVYALHLGLRTRQGGVHTPADVRRWLAAAGLEDAEAIDLGDTPGAEAAIRAWRRP